MSEVVPSSNTAFSQRTVFPQRAAFPQRAILDTAERTLVIARGLSYAPEQAFHELLSVATHHRIAVLTLARALIDVSETHVPENLPADTPHTVAFAEWGELLDLPTPQASVPATDTSYDYDHEPGEHEPAVEFLLSSDIAGRVVWVSLAFTLGAIVGFFAHDWSVVLLVLVAGAAWTAVALVRKVVRLPHSRQWPATDRTRDHSGHHTVTA